MNKDLEMLKRLFLTDPETEDKLIISSTVVVIDEGYFNFTVTNPKTGVIWRITVQIEEI